MDDLLDIQGLQWSKSGACGLTCVRMMLNYKLGDVHYENEKVKRLIKDYEKDHRKNPENFNNFDKQAFWQEASIAKIIYDDYYYEPPCHNFYEFVFQDKVINELIFVLDKFFNKEIDYDYNPENEGCLDFNILNNYMFKVKQCKALPAIMEFVYSSSKNINHYVLINGLIEGSILYLDPADGFQHEEVINRLKGQAFIHYLPFNEID